MTQENRVVVITLDDSSGVLEMGMRIEGGYTPESQACQMANMLVNHMDTIAARSDDKVREFTVSGPTKPSILVPGLSLVVAG